MSLQYGEACTSCFLSFQSDINASYCAFSNMFPNFPSIVLTQIAWYLSEPLFLFDSISFRPLFTNLL